jgi:hypothetical protein
MFIPSETPDVIYDRIHEWTDGINHLVGTNDTAFKMLIIPASFLLDVVSLFSFFRFALLGRSWRFVIAFGTYFLFRALIQTLSVLP